MFSLLKKFVSSSCYQQKQTTVAFTIALPFQPFLYPCNICSSLADAQDQAVGSGARLHGTRERFLYAFTGNRQMCLLFVFLFCFFNQRCLNHIYVCNGVTPRVKSSIDEEPLNNKPKIEWKRKIYKNLV
jgi:hypothetical protein